MKVVGRIDSSDSDRLTAAAPGLKVAHATSAVDSLALLFWCMKAPDFKNTRTLSKPRRPLKVQR